MGKIIFVIVDANSKWLEAARLVPSRSTAQDIHMLNHVFSTYGLLRCLFPTMGLHAFTSSEFQTFVKRNGFRHIKSAPYHPATNGLAKRAAPTIKNALKKKIGDLEMGLFRFRFQYRLTPHSTTGCSPTVLLLGRKPRSHLEFFVPSSRWEITFLY